MMERTGGAELACPRGGGIGENRVPRERCESARTPFRVQAADELRRDHRLAVAADEVGVDDEDAVLARGVHRAVARGEPVAIGWCRGDVDDGLRRCRARGAEEGRAAEREDPAVLADEPVPTAPRARDARDRRGEAHAPGGSGEAGVAEREDAAVGGGEPVAVAGGCGGDADDGSVEAHPAGGSEEAGVPEAEDAAVGGGEPVAVAGWCGGDADDGSVEAHPAGGSEEAGVAEGEDAAVGGGEPVAVAVGLAAMPTIGWLRRMPPVDPRKRASPKLKMPPSVATSQYPLPDGVAAMSTTARFNTMRAADPCGAVAALAAVDPKHNTAASADVHAATIPPHRRPEVTLCSGCGECAPAEATVDSASDRPEAIGARSPRSITPLRQRSAPTRHRTRRTQP